MKGIISLALNLITLISFGQVKNEYSVSEIKDWQEFEKLTLLELRFYEINEESNELTDSMYENNSLYLPNVPEDKKRELYEEMELKARMNFKENRARYFVKYIEEDSLIVDKTFSTPDTISTECRCELNKDTIQISMGIWIFGGYSYNISIIDNIFKLVYIEDAHESKPYKYNKADTSMVEDLILEVDDVNLVFSDEIKPKIGEHLNGYLKFTSPEYYVDSNFRGYSRKDNLSKGVTKGEIFFTCKIREPLKPAKE